MDETLPRVQRINGYPLNLGTMDEVQLTTIYDQCQTRSEKALVDAATVTQYLGAVTQIPE